MNVIVNLHTSLQRSTPEGLIRRLEVELRPGATLGDLCQQLQIAVDVENMLLVVNHCNVELDQVLTDSDEIHLIPAISGG
jgi:molybdopterin converting factor small subunit